jgi:hypothetical protein
MACHVNSASAGRDVSAFETGVKRFCDEHPDVNWQIEAGQHAGQLHITVVTAEGKMLPVEVQQSQDMAEAVFRALEQALNTR